MLAEFSRETEQERKSFLRDEILGSLEAQGTAGALLPPSFPPPFPVFSTSFTSSLASPSLLLAVYLVAFFTLFNSNLSFGDLHVVCYFITLEGPLKMLNLFHMLLMLLFGLDSVG